MVNLNFIIAFSGGTLTAGVAKTFGLNDYLDYGLFGFFSILFVYNGQRLYKAKAHSQIPSLKWVFKHRWLILITSVISFFLSFYFLFHVLGDITVLEFVTFGVAIPVTFFYVVPIRGRNIRERPHLKAHATALAWTIVIIVFPLINANVTDSFVAILFASALYCYFLAITISFDIRDLKYDPPTQRTIPQVIGSTKAKAFTITLLLFSGVSIGFVSNIYFSQPLFLVAILVQMMLIGFARKDYSDAYYTILIDGSVSLLGISFLVSSY